MIPHIKTRQKGKEMEFLKEVLGEELFSQVATAINAYNGNEANKDKQIKVGNLGTGDYVSKGKFESLQETLTGKTTELDAANELIAKLKKGTKDSDTLQNTIADYEARNEKLQKELAETQLKSAIKIALLSEKAVDVDYLTFKLEQNNAEISLDENGQIKGWTDMVSELKTAHPTMFDTAKGGSDGYKPVGDNNLPKGDGDETLKKADILKMSYADRQKLATEDPEAYNKAMGR